MAKIAVGQGPAAMVANVPNPQPGTRVTIKQSDILWAATPSASAAVRFVLTGGGRTAEFQGERLMWFGASNVEHLTEPPPSSSSIRDL